MHDSKDIIQLFFFTPAESQASTAQRSLEDLSQPFVLHDSLTRVGTLHKLDGFEQDL